MNKKIIGILVVALLIATVLPVAGAMDDRLDQKRNDAALGPDLVYYPTSHDFGNVGEGKIHRTIFEIWNGGTDTLTWNLGIVHTWVSPNPTSGSSTGEHDPVTVTIDTTGLSSGSYSGFVSISANDGGGLRYFNVYFNVNNAPYTPSIPSGPTSGFIDMEYGYYTSTTDPDGGWLSYRLDFGNKISDWTAYTGPGIGNSVNNIWSVPGTYQVKAQAKDILGATSEWSSPLLVTISSTENQPPVKPSTPSGSTNGKAGTSYTYSTSTTDPEGDQIYYKWDWGDEVSDWDGPYNSGDTATASHIWANQGSYSVKVKAKDIHDEESVWSDPLPITMPKNKAINPFLLFLERLIERFPILEQLLQPIYDKLAGF